MSRINPILATVNKSAGTLAVCTLVALVWTCPRAAAQGRGGGPSRPPPDMPPGMAAMAAQSQEIAKNTLAGARQLSRSLPDSKYLGPDWKRAWELPPSVPQRVASEDEYWQRAIKEMGTAGMSEAQARSAADQFGTLFAQAGAGSGLGEREGLILALSQFRGQNAPPHTKMLSGLEIAARSFQAAAQARGPDGRPDQQQALKLLMDATAAPFQGMSLPQLKEAFVKEATLVRQRTQMAYFRSNNWPALAQARSDREVVERGLWVGVVKVSLMIADAGRIGEVPTLREADAPALLSKLDAALRSVVNGTLQLRQQQVNQRLERAQALPNGPARDSALREAAADREKLQQEAAAFGRLAVAVDMRQFGDNSYVIRLSGVSPDTAGLGFGLYSGWLRKGSALAEVTLGGNFPEDQLKKEMDHFLAEMDHVMTLTGGELDRDPRPPVHGAGPGRSEPPPRRFGFAPSEAGVPGRPVYMHRSAARAHREDRLSAAPALPHDAPFILLAVGPPTLRWGSAYFRGSGLPNAHWRGA